jgi:hypothetical protein
MLRSPAAPLKERVVTARMDPAPSDPRRADGTAAYRFAIDGTSNAVQKRARNFRNLVVAVVLIGVIGFVWAIAARSVLPLAAWLFAIPACNIFLVADARALNRWRSDILANWVARDLDLTALGEAIRAHPALPRETTTAMLATLPTEGGIVFERGVLNATRRAVAARIRCVDETRAHTLVLTTAASSVGTGCVATALWTARWWPLLGLTILALTPLGTWWLRRRHEARGNAQIAGCREEPGFDEASYQALRARVP